MKHIEKLAAKYIYWPEIENPFQKNIDFGQNKVSQLVPVIEDVVNSEKVMPDLAITRFYALNQYLSEQRLKDNNILDNDLIDTYKEYQATIDDLSKKMFSYIFCISLMEARHSYDFHDNEEEIDSDMEYWEDEYYNKNDEYPSDEQKDRKRARLESKHKNEILSHYKQLCPSGFYTKFLASFNILNTLFEADMGGYREGIVENVMGELKSADVSIADFMKTLSIVFDRDSFDSGYGGEPWRDITEHGLKFAKGEINAEVFVDQAFSLEHNGGCMFNKDVIFENLEESVSLPTAQPTDNSSFYYSTEDILLGKTQFLLNMQHQGQILNFLNLHSYSEEAIEEVSGAFTKDIKHGFDKSLRDSVSKFIHAIAQEARPYAQDPVISKIIEKNKKNASTLDFTASLGCVVSEEWSRSVLSESSADTLKWAEKTVSQLLSNKQVVNTVYNKKNVLFEVFNTSDIPRDKQDKLTLGGKAYGLNQMQQLDLPVPKAAVWTCENSRSYSQQPKAWMKILQKQMPGVQSFNVDASGRDVMVSIRSGAPVSMPGMMDTILNVGIDNSNYEHFAQKLGRHTADECAIKFMKLFTKSYFDKDIVWPTKLASAQKKFRNILKEHGVDVCKEGFPLTKEDQIQYSLEAVFKSWNSPRAAAYRNHHHIDNNMGTAAIMQHMVFGNLNEESCTGVLFSRDCINGKSGLIGEFLVCGQGEEVVSGEVTPTNISEMKEWNPDAYKKLTKIANMLEEKTGQIQDIEFTIEDGEVYILQCRTAVSSPTAKMSLLKEKLKNGKINFEEFLTHLDTMALSAEKYVNTQEPVAFKGLTANPGTVSGICVQTLADLETYREKAKKENLKFILISEETKPEHAEIMMATDAFLTQKGGFTSHAAILARSWNKPCIVGALNDLKTGEVVTLDSKAASVWRGVQPTDVKKETAFINNLVSQQKINTRELHESNQKELQKINMVRPWMAFAEKSKEIKPKVKSFNKFLDMGQLAVMKMSVAAKRQNVKAM